MKPEGCGVSKAAAVAKTLQLQPAGSEHPYHPDMPISPAAVGYDAREHAPMAGGAMPWLFLAVREGDAACAQALLDAGWPWALKSFSPPPPFLFCRSMAGH